MFYYCCISRKLLYRHYTRPVPGGKVLFPVDLTEFTRGNPFLFAERFDEITEVIESAGIGNIRDGFVCVGQFQAGLVDTVLVQIFNRCIMRHFLEKFTEIIR